MANINDFKAKLAQAAAQEPISLRLQCLFLVMHKLVVKIEDFAFLCKSAQLPDMTICCNVPFRGRNIKIATIEQSANGQLLFLMTQTLN